jgi:4a-hydroxytetrahydrobiopterin dehydratase
MTDLAQRRCVPCSGETPALPRQEIERLLQEVPGYELEAEPPRISRTYRFKNYYQSIAFVNALAWIVHAEDHHPDLTVSYDRVRVSFWTHAVGGLTLNDFVCAAKVNALLSIGESG